MIESSKNLSGANVLHYGMVGGGEDSFIGDVHRKSAMYDGKCKIVCGCFSRDYENTLRTGAALGISPDRLYRDFNEMAQREKERDGGIDFAVIVTPNSSHFLAAKAFLEAGIHVVCEKPLTCTVEQAGALRDLAREKDLILCVPYNYSGYPLVKQARKLVRDGKIGDVVMVMGEYPQDWLMDTVERGGQRQAAWRTDPGLSGVSNCVGDIGSHIENTVAYITGMKIKSLCAKLDIIGEERVLDTNASVLLEYANGATGMYWSSQVAAGYDNGLRVRVFGTKGSLEWAQEFPNVMSVTFKGQPTQTYCRGNGYLDDVASSRLPSGHSEGYNDAFANVYNSFATALLLKKDGQSVSSAECDYQDAEAGIDGVRFIHKCVESSQKGSVWVEM